MFKTLIGSDYAIELLTKLNQSKKNIDIVMYDWRFYPDNPEHPISEINQAIFRAVNRGVIVRCVVNNREIANNLKPYKVQAKYLKSSRILHSKIVIIDNEILFIGSHNLTRNAVTTNLESSLMLEIPKEETRIFEYFKNLFESN